MVRTASSRNCVSVSGSRAASDSGVAISLSPLLRPFSPALAVLLGDPGRNYFTAQGLEELARYEIPTSLQLENRGMRETVVWRVLPLP